MFINDFKIGYIENNNCPKCPLSLFVCLGFMLENVLSRRSIGILMCFCLMLLIDSLNRIDFR